LKTFAVIFLLLAHNICHGSNPVQPAAAQDLDIIAASEILMATRTSPVPTQQLSAVAAARILDTVTVPPSPLPAAHLTSYARLLKMPKTHPVSISDLQRSPQPTSHVTFAPSHQSRHRSKKHRAHPYDRQSSEQPPSSTDSEKPDPIYAHIQHYMALDTQLDKFRFNGTIKQHILTSPNPINQQEILDFIKEEQKKKSLDKGKTEHFISKISLYFRLREEKKKK